MFEDIVDKQLGEIQVGHQHWRKNLTSEDSKTGGTWEAIKHASGGRHSKLGSVQGQRWRPVFGVFPY